MSDLPRRVGVTGAAGYIAGRLIDGLVALESVESVLATDIRQPQSIPSPKVEFLRQDVGEPFPDLFVGRELDAVVHLAGENIASGRWTAARKARIKDSRVGGTRLLADAMAAEVAHHRVAGFLGVCLDDAGDGR